MEETDGSSTLTPPTPSSTPSSAASVPAMSQESSRSIRSKSDPAWAYISESRGNDGKRSFICNFCAKVVRGGGIHRMKMHLAGQRGEVGPCKKVPIDVRYKMQESLQEVQDQKRDNELHQAATNPFGTSVHPFEVNMVEGSNVEIRQGSGARGSTSKKRKASGMTSYFHSGSKIGAQPTIKAALQSKERWHEVDLAIARFFYDACIPMRAVNSFYFQPMIDAIACLGLGYKGLTYYALRTNLLEESKKELQLLVDIYRSSWEDCGCTIMGDGWKDIRQRSLINFLAYSPRGICFIKSVDASDMVSDAQTLCNLFAEIVEIVGKQNVVHLVTDNAANYKAAGRLLNERYLSILWTPCAAHCLNLILKDIAKMPHIESSAKRASSITVFVYNHNWTLSWLRNRKGWIEILRPGDTRFATTFIALKSIYDHKCDLQAMVTSRDFLGWNGSKTKKAKDVENVVLDNQFWNDSLVVVKIVAPLVRLLRIMDSDEKPALGYVYEGMSRANKVIKETFKYVKRLYQPYISILEERWERQLRQDIHAAAFWLNPAFQYDPEKFCQSPDVMDGFLTIISNHHLTPNHKKMVAKSSTFRKRLGSFGNSLSQSASKNTRPYEWWRFFGHSAPNLQKLAIRILSQTASSSGCERNWSVFERIHTKRRNRLEHQKLSDLVFIHYNLRLKNRIYNKSKANALDPIDYECIDNIDSWIVENELPQEPELNFEELENMVAQGEGEAQQGHQTNNENANNIDDDDEEDMDGADDISLVQDGIDFSSFMLNQGNEQDEIHGNDEN